MAQAEIKSKATLDASNFNRNLAGMKQGVESFGTGQINKLGAMLAGAFTVGAIINFTKQTFAGADALEDMSSNLGTTIEGLQTLRVLAERTGSSAEGMDKTLGRISKTQVEAANGNKTMIDSYQRLGVSLDEIKSLSSDQMFERIARATRNVSPVSEEMSGAQRILGKESIKLNNVLNTVANDGLQNIQNKMLENNEIMSVQSVQAAARMQESYERLADKMKVKASNVTIEFFGGLKAAGLEMDNMMKRLANPLRVMMGKKELSETDVAKELFGDLSSTGKTGGGTKQSIPKIAKNEFAVDVGKDNDSIARIGGVIGAQFNPERLQQRMIVLQEQSNEIAERTQKGIEDLNSNIAAGLGGD